MKHHTTWRSRCCFFTYRWEGKKRITETNWINAVLKIQSQKKERVCVCVCVCAFTPVLSLLLAILSINFAKHWKNYKYSRPLTQSWEISYTKVQASLQILWVIPPWKRSPLNSTTYASRLGTQKCLNIYKGRKKKGKKQQKNNAYMMHVQWSVQVQLQEHSPSGKSEQQGRKKPNPSHLWPADFNPFTISVLAVWIFCQTQWQFSCGLWYHLKFLPDFQKEADFYFSDLSLSPRNLAVSWQRPGQIHFLSLAQAGFKLGKQKSCFWPTYCAPQHHSGPMTPLFSIISLVVIGFGVAYFLWKVGGGGGIIQICPKKIVTPILNFMLLLLPFGGGGRGHITLLFCGGWRGAYYHHLASHRVTGSWEPTPPPPPPKKKKHVKIETGGIHPCCITTAYQKSMSASRKQNFPSLWKIHKQL